MTESQSGARRLVVSMIAHGIVLAATLSVVSQLAGAPFWRVGPGIQPVLFLCAAYLATVVITAIVRWLDLSEPLLPPAAFGALCGLGFLGLLILPRALDRAMLLAAFGLLALGACLLYLLPRLRVAWTVLFGLILMVSASVPFWPATDAGSNESEVGYSLSEMRTSVYDLERRTYEAVVPRSGTHSAMGALAGIDGAYVLALSSGDIYTIRGLGEGPHLSVKKWKSRVPLTYDAFLASAKDQSFSNYFRVMDVLVNEATTPRTIYFTHHHWDEESSCATLRVSSTSSESLSRLETEKIAWRTIFETQPCFPLQDEAWAFRGMEGGGRMALNGPSELLVTVGDHGFNGHDFDDNWVDDPEASYGKTIAVDLVSGLSSVFSTGHRNQQGLWVSRDGTVWSSEHGPEGGDELNELVRGGQYGWPGLTYGTDYGTLAWPVEPPTEPSEFMPPVFAWVPSIGASNMTGVEDSIFPRWQDDLIVGSMVGQSVFRVHLEDGVARYAEPIALGERVRDILADENGLIIWTDSRRLLQILPAPDEN